MHQTFYPLLANEHFTAYNPLCILNDSWYKICIGLTNLVLCPILFALDLIVLILTIISFFMFGLVDGNFLHHSSHRSI